MLHNIKQLIVRARNRHRVRHRAASPQAELRPARPDVPGWGSFHITARQHQGSSCGPTTEVDHTDQMVLHQLLVRLSDTEIQEEDLLAIEKLTLTVADTFVMDREVAKRSQGSINTGSAARVISSYKKGKHDTRTESCRNCWGAVYQGATLAETLTGQRHNVHMWENESLPQSLQAQRHPTRCKWSERYLLSIIHSQRYEAHLRSQCPRTNTLESNDSSVLRTALLRTRTSLRSGDGRPLTVIGTIAVMLSAMSDTGDKKSTSQWLYIAR